MRVPVPGLAGWSARASASLIEISIAGGVVTAYSYALVFARPVFALVEAAALLLGWHMQSLFYSLYWVLGVGFLVWQAAERGRTGQSLGQRLMRIVTVDEDTGAPVGPARSILRSVLHFLDIGPVFFGYLRPVFHYRGQTFADQICRTVVVGVETVNAIAEVRT
jgi:uncharacterized RDD family membrane protein YckC